MALISGHGARRGARDRAAHGLEGLGLGRLTRRAPAWNGAVVINHHRVGDAAEDPLDRALYSATPEGLEAQVAFLARHFELVRAEELPALAATGRGRYAALTFDDGYRDGYETVLPILEAYGAPATFFISTGFIDAPRVAWWDEITWIACGSRRDVLDLRPWLAAPLAAHDRAAREGAARAIAARYKSLPAAQAELLVETLARAAGTGRAPAALARGLWMTWDMVRALAAAGMGIGGHTINHPVLSRLPPATQRREVAGCLARIEAQTGRRPRSFSYPVGTRDAFDGITRTALAAEGVTCAFSYYGGWCRFARWDPYDVPRAYVGPATTPERLRAMVTLPAVFAR